MGEQNQNSQPSELPADMCCCHEQLISTLQEIEAERLEKIQADNWEMLAEGLDP